jgi:predicted site-specific integrase-resolvase
MPSMSEAVMNILDYSNAKIIIENTEEKNINEEITQDLIEIITVYS